MQVPTLEAPSVQEEPLPGRAYPRFSEEAPEAAFGTPVAQGLEHVAQAGVEEQVQAKQQNDQLRVIDAMTQLSAGHDALLFGKDGRGGAYSMHGIDAVNMPEKFIPAYRQMAAQISSTLTPDQQRMFYPHVARTQQELNLGLNRYEAEEANRLAAKTYAAGRDQAIQSAGLNYRDNTSVQKNIMDLHALNEMEAAREGWTPVEKHEQLVQSIARLHASVIDSMLADKNGTLAREYFNAHQEDIKEFNPRAAEAMERSIKSGIVGEKVEGAMQAYLSEGQAAGQKAAADLMKDPTLDPMERMQAMGMLNRGLSERAEAMQQDPGVQAQIRSIDDAIAMKKGAGPPGDWALGAVDSLVQRGALTFQQGEVKRDAVLRAQQIGSQNQISLDYVDDAFANSRPLDPKKDREAVNMWVAMHTMGQPPGSDAYNATVAEVMRRVGVMPTSAEEYGRTMMTSGNPQDAAKAARLFDVLDRTNHAAYEYGTDATVRAQAYGINEAVKAGASPEASVEQQRELDKMDPAQRKLLDERWKNLKPHGDAWEAFDKDLIRNGLAGDEHFTQRTFIGTHPASSVPQIPDEMAGEFAARAKEYFYLRGGNLNQAQQLALADLKRVWGVDTINGDRTIMKYAPGRMHPEIPEADIRRDLDNIAGDESRLQEFGGTGTSQGMQWWVMKPDQFGAYSPVLGSNNMPRVYELPTGGGLAALREQAAAAETRARVQQRIEGRIQQEREESEAEERTDIAQTSMPHF